MQLMHILNCLYASNCSGVWWYSSSRDWSTFRIIQGFDFDSFTRKSEVSTTKSQDGKVLQGLHPQRAWSAVRKECGARQLGDPVYHHSATPAHSHAARPTKGQCPIQMVLNVIQRIEHHPLFSNFRRWSVQ